MFDQSYNTCIHKIILVFTKIISWNNCPLTLRAAYLKAVVLSTIGRLVLYRNFFYIFLHHFCLKSVFGEETYSPVENQYDLELDFKVFFFVDSCC